MWRSRPAGRARLYLDRTAGPAQRIGVDIALREEDGRVRGGVTGALAALPSLVHSELARHLSGAEDPCCAAVYDFTRW
ncbi:hypothetical protein ACGFNX_05550 [Streptomyces sp. NPDC048723]|uniref:hypothetical protein n=1 Tax=Streptomyces sp. NPDC048723 TaxID=3365589 RepID=UPI00371B2C56